MTPRRLADVRDYDALLNAFRARVDELGTTYSAIEDYAGLPTGHLGHILGRSQNKTLGVILVFRLMEALGLRFDVVEHLDVAATIDEMEHHYRPVQGRFQRNGFIRKHISNDVKIAVMREMGARGGSVPKRFSITPKARVIRAKKAARARWQRGPYKLGRN